MKEFDSSKEAAQWLAKEFIRISKSRSFQGYQGEINYNDPPYSLDFEIKPAYDVRENSYIRMRLKLLFKGSEWFQMMFIDRDGESLFVKSRRDIDALMERQEVAVHKGNPVFRIADDILEFMQHEVEPMKVLGESRLYSMRFTDLDYYMISEEARLSFSSQVDSLLRPGETCEISCHRSGEYKVGIRYKSGHPCPTITLTEGEMGPTNTGLFSKICDVIHGHWNNHLNNHNVVDPTLRRLMVASSSENIV